MPKTSIQSSRKVRREISPPAHQAWLRAQEDLFTQFEGKFVSWLNGINAFHEVAKNQLYDNEDFTEMDLRYHRSFLASLIADGENLVIQILELMGKELIGADDAESRTTIIDQHLAVLTKRLHQWHGAPEDQADIPDSFKIGMTEIAEGKVVDMEKALSKAPSI